MLLQLSVYLRRIRFQVSSYKTYSIAVLCKLKFHYSDWLYLIQSVCILQVRFCNNNYRNNRALQSCFSFEKHWEREYSCLETRKGISLSKASGKRLSRSCVYIWWRQIDTLTFHLIIIGWMFSISENIGLRSLYVWLNYLICVRRRYSYRFNSRYALSGSG